MITTTVRSPISAWLGRLISPGGFLVAGLLFVACYCFVDKPVALAVKQAHWSGIELFLLKWITRAAEGTYTIIVLVVVVLWSWLRRQAVWFGRSSYLLLAVLVADISCDVLKIILGRARPLLLFRHHHLYGFYFWQTQSRFWSCPSGHVTHAAVFLMGVGLLAPRWRYVCLLGVAVVAMSRILLLYHYPSDVLGGFYLGALVAYGIWLKYPPVDLANKFLK